MTNIAKPKILVTGATGNIGRELVKELSLRGMPFRVMVRHQKGAGLLGRNPLVDTVIGDFEDRASLAAALVGTESAFLLTPSSERAEAQQLSFVEEAKKAGVRHIVKLSQWRADPNSPVRFLRYHAAIETKIRASGLDYTFLRPNLFMQGMLAFQDSIRQDDQFFAAIGDTGISVVDTRDIAAVAAASLSETGHEGRVYDLTGPEALSHAQMAEILSTALGRTIQFAEVSPEMMLDSLLQVGFPTWQAEGLLEDYAHYARGEATVVADGVQRAIHQEPRSFEAFSSDYASAFS